MIVTNVRWDAVDARVPITNGANAYDKNVWSRRPDAGDKWAGGIPPATVATEIGSPGRARDKS